MTEDNGDYLPEQTVEIEMSQEADQQLRKIAKRWNMSVSECLDDLIHLFNNYDWLNENKEIAEKELQRMKTDLNNFVSQARAREG